MLEEFIETLIGSEERFFSKESKNFYTLNPDLRDLNYSKYYSEGTKRKEIKKYSSNNVRMLNANEILKILLKLDLGKNQI